jgi:hypothetical protein
MKQLKRGKVRAILADKISEGKPLYRVSWVAEEGKKPAAPTWEPEDSLILCEFALKQYLAAKTKKAKSLVQASNPTDPDSDDEPLSKYNINIPSTVTSTTTTAATTTTNVPVTDVAATAVTSTTTTTTSDAISPFPFATSTTSVQTIYDSLSQQPEWATATWSKRWDAATVLFSSQTAPASRVGKRRHI